jgi:peptidase E
VFCTGVTCFWQELSITNSKKMYKQIKTIDGSINDSSIQHIETTAFIPFAPDNTDYQKYLEWLADGNTPQPADTEE